MVNFKNKIFKICLAINIIIFFVEYCESKCLKEQSMHQNLEANRIEKKDKTDENFVLKHYVKCYKSSLNAYFVQLNRPITHANLQNNNEPYNNYEKIITDAFLARKKAEYLEGLQWLASAELLVRKFLGSSVYDIEKNRIQKDKGNHDFLLQNAAEDHLAGMIGKYIAFRSIINDSMDMDDKKIVKQIDEAVDINKNILNLEGIWYRTLPSTCCTMWKRDLYDKYRKDSSSQQKLFSDVIKNRCLLYNQDDKFVYVGDLSDEQRKEALEKKSKKSSNEPNADKKQRQKLYYSMTLHRQKPQNYRYSDLLADEKQLFCNKLRIQYDTIPSSDTVSSESNSKFSLDPQGKAANIFDSISNNMKKDKGLIGGCFKSVGLEKSIWW